MSIRSNSKVKQFFISCITWLTHPIVVFVILQILWVAITFLWVIWFVEQKNSITELTAQLRRTVTPSYSLLFLVIGCILLGMMLVGTVVLFVFAQKQASLIRQQRNFVSSVTHELRSPLASLQLSFETLRKDDTPFEVRTELFNMAQKDIDRLIRLVDRILISARLDRGIIDLNAAENQEILVFDTINKMRNQFVHLDPQLAERLIVECPPDLRLKIVPLAINLILGNLIENAINYSPPNSKVVIKAEDQLDNVTISIEDQGYGIAKKDLRRIFKMFHRTNVSRRKAIPGTGLGLYIVKSTIDIIGGKVWAESRGIGLGSTFKVRFSKREGQLAG
jgi:signal transduction histidine kinase